MAKTFEDNIARLEEIVTALEKGDAKLADSLKPVSYTHLRAHET